MLLIVVGTSCVARFCAVQESEARLGSWGQTSQYGIFYPRSVGADLEELQSGQEFSLAAEVFQLYPALNEQGALFVDASLYTPLALTQEMPPDRYRSLKVNPNYLEEYPVFSASGDPVTVPEGETDWIVLVPERYRTEEDSIVRAFQAQRAGDESIESVYSYDEHMFGRAVSDEVRNQDVTIIWTASDQRVFSFHPEVAPDDGNCIVDPIIEVMTMGNSVGLDRMNSFTGGPDACVKVKLTDQDTKKTLQGLQGLLKELNLDDNFLHLVTLNDYALAWLQQLQQQLRDTALLGAVVLVLFLIFAIQSVSLLFEKDARRIAMRRLYGYPFAMRHRGYLTVFSVTWAVMALALTAIAVLFGERLVLPPVGVAALYGVAGVFLLLEVLVSALALTFVESRRISNVLKGEF